MYIMNEMVSDKSAPQGVDDVLSVCPNEVSEINENDRESILERVEKSSEMELTALLQSRVTSELFKALLHNRDYYRKNFDVKQKKSKKIARSYYNNRIENNHGKMRKAQEIERIAYYDFMQSNHLLEEYKNNTALIAAKISETAFEKEYAYDSFGTAYKTVEYPSGSREWLEQRQSGIGGSDVGAILKLGKWGPQNYKQVWNSKIHSITDEEVEEQETNNSQFSGPAGRGNAWEALIAKDFLNRNPKYDLLHSKASWVSEIVPWQFANFDGILLNRKTGEYEILEIKTSSNSDDWVHGVPVSYRAQVLHYMNTTGIKKAQVAVVIDDSIYKSYEIFADEPFDIFDPLKRTYADRMKELQDFYDETIQEKEKLTDIHTQKSFFKYSSDKEKSIVLRDLSAFLQKSEHDVNDLIENNIQQGLSVDEAIREVYKSVDVSSWDKDIVSIDLETSSGSVSRGEIIEVGVIRFNTDGIVDTYQALFDIDERIKKVKGTGEEKVHNISVEDIADQSFFTDRKVQNKMKEILGVDDDSTIMLAHNAVFEKRFLNHFLEGFHKSDIKGIDTMRLARYFDHDTDDNTLESFANKYGVPYENAHRALVDAEMTQKALMNFVDALKTTTNKLNI